ncbi:hypothetical protein [Pseudomonas sp. NY15374]|uniref:hypothetical protein n=1 Tax=Pseudomonas sp. NY15374 TaxID=3400357 RepID=UPI003A87D802
MIITLYPTRMDETLFLSRDGDALIVNGEVFDLSPLADGATLPCEAIDSDWFCGPVEKVEGVLTVALRLPYGPNAPEATKFPQPIRVTNHNGQVDLPLYGTPADSSQTEEYPVEVGVTR